MKKIEEERQQEMKLSRLQAVQRVKQYKQVCVLLKVYAQTYVLTAPGHVLVQCVLGGACELLALLVTCAGSAVQEGHAKRVCSPVEESAGEASKGWQ